MPYPTLVEITAALDAKVAQIAAKFAEERDLFDQINALTTQVNEAVNERQQLGFEKATLQNELLAFFLARRAANPDAETYAELGADMDNVVANQPPAPPPPEEP